MRTRKQMRATLAEYPAVSAALDELADEYGEVVVSTLDDFCERYPGSAPLQRAAVRINGSSAGWFLVTAAGNRIWMVPATGKSVEITKDLPGGSERA